MSDGILQNARELFGQIEDGQEFVAKQFGFKEGVDRSIGKTAHIQGTASAGLDPEERFYVTAGSTLGDYDTGFVYIVEGYTAIKRVELGLRHPGGCQVANGYLVIPFENDRASEIYVIDIKEHPHLDVVGVPLNLDNKAGSAGLTRTPTGWALVVADSQYLYFYRSTEEVPTATSFEPASIPIKVNKGENYANGVSLFSDPDGRLWVMAPWTKGPSDAGPFTDYIDLIEADPDSNKAERVERKHIKNRGGGVFGAHPRWASAITAGDEGDSMLIMVGSRGKGLVGNDLSEEIYVNERRIG